MDGLASERKLGLLGLLAPLLGGMAAQLPWTDIPKKNTLKPGLSI